jgi:hypothetical protein
MHANAHLIDSVIRSRKAVRVFRPDAVSRQDIVEILDSRCIGMAGSDGYRFASGALTLYEIRPAGKKKSAMTAPPLTSG